MLSQHGQAFPESTEQVLGFLDIRLQEGAPRTWYSSFLSTLAFFELAGERNNAEALHQLPALTGAVNEASANTARSETGGRRGRQAPPFVVAQVVAMEEFVLCEAQPRYSRAYAWFKLLRHWTAMRWDDTRGLNPGS